LLPFFLLAGPPFFARRREVGLRQLSNSLRELTFAAASREQAGWPVVGARALAECRKRWQRRPLRQSGVKAVRVLRRPGGLAAAVRLALAGTLCPARGGDASAPPNVTEGGPASVLAVRGQLRRQPCGLRLHGYTCLEVGRVDAAPLRLRCWCRGRAARVRAGRARLAGERRGAGRRGSTPLTVASDLGHAGIVKALLAAGADVNAASNSGADLGLQKSTSMIGLQKITSMIFAKKLCKKIQVMSTRGWNDH